MNAHVVSFVPEFMRLVNQTKAQFKARTQMAVDAHQMPITFQSCATQVVWCAKSKHHQRG